MGEFQGKKTADQKEQKGLSHIFQKHPDELQDIWGTILWATKTKEELLVCVSLHLV